MPAVMDDPSPTLAPRVTVTDASRSAAAIHLEHVSVVRDGRALLDDISWEVAPGQRWAVLGPNGSGKTTLLRVVGSSLWPTRGIVELLGERLGHVDMRQLRTRIAVVSASVARSLRPEIPALDVVLTGRFAAVETWWNEYTEQDRDQAACPAGRGRIRGRGRLPSDRSGCCPRGSVNRSCWPGP